MEGRAPAGMDEETAALFPDELVESELGLVPKGWKVGVIGDLFALNKGTINPLRNPDVLYEHYSLPAFDQGQMPEVEMGVDIKSNKTSINSKCVLLSKLNPHIPRVWLPSRVNSNSICSTEFLPLMSRLTTSTSFVYAFLSSDIFINSLGQYTTGTSNSHQRIKPDVLLTEKALVPDLSVLVAYEKIADCLHERLKVAREQCSTLTKIRDAVLPRLISGKLRLTDDELEAQT